MFGMESLGNLLGIGTTFTPLLNFLGALRMWALNMVDAYVLDLGQLGFGIDFLGFTSTFG